jgi:hypothetical protein
VWGEQAADVGRVLAENPLAESPVIAATIQGQDDLSKRPGAAP